MLTSLLLSIWLCIVKTDAFQRMLITAHIENVLTKNLYFRTNLQTLSLNRTSPLKHIVANVMTWISNLKYFKTQTGFLIRTVNYLFYEFHF
jgi:hypothetical protein